MKGKVTIILESEVLSSDEMAAIADEIEFGELYVEDPDVGIFIVPDEEV
jgi:hypothetical protein